MAYIGSLPSYLADKFKSIDFLDEHFELNFKNGSNSIKYVHVMEMKYGGIFFKKFSLLATETNTL